MVLYNSATNEPLASFMLQAHAEDLPYAAARVDAEDLVAGSFAPVVLYPRAKDAQGRVRFHSVVGQDKQFAEFVLTNLCLEGEGCINFNVSKDGIESEAGMVNEINVLTPLQSLKVYADFSEASNKMVLHTKTRAVVDPETGLTELQPISVKQDEDEVKSGAKTVSEGVHYCLAVTPEMQRPKLQAKFHHLEWRVVDMVTLKCPPPPQLPLPSPTPPPPRAVVATVAAVAPTSPFGIPFGTFGAPLWAPFASVGSFSAAVMPYSYSNSSPSTFGGPSPPVIPTQSQPAGGSFGGFGGFGSAPFGVASSSSFPSPSPPAGSHNFGTVSTFGAAPSTGFSDFGSFGATAPPPPTASSSSSSSLSSGGFSFGGGGGGGGGALFDLGSFGATSVIPNNNNNHSSSSPSSGDDGGVNEQSILDSQIAEARRGGFAQVHSQLDQRVFDPEAVSPPCVLGVSVSVTREIQIEETWWVQEPCATVFLRFPLDLQHVVQSAYYAWLASGKHPAHRAFRFFQPQHQNDASSGVCNVLDFACMNGVRIVSVDEIQFYTIRRDAAKTRLVGGIVLGAPKSHDEWTRQAMHDTNLLKRGVNVALRDQIVQTFVSNECCVCLEANPSMILAMCGHQCLCASKDCYTAIEKCPLCRARVTAKVVA